MEPLIGLSKPGAPDGPAEEPILDGNEAGFGQDVIEASMRLPVIVDFWAPWCGPCKQLGPALEKVVRAARGKVRLVKINVDENQMLAQQLRIQSIPAVYAFIGGRPVDGFAGALPESQIKAFVDKLVKSAGPGLDEEDPVQQVLAEAQAALDNGDVEHAKALFAQVLNHDPSEPKAMAGVIRCVIAEGLTDQARQMLDALPPELANAPEIQAARSALDLAAEAGAAAGQTAQLSDAVARNPDDHQARFDLAMGLYADGQGAEAVDHLVEIVRRKRDWNDEAARKQLLKLFEAFGPTDPVTVEGRRKLSAVLFS